MKFSCINSEPLELAHQFRQFTQIEVAEIMKLPQGLLSKAEQGIPGLDLPTLERHASFYNDLMKLMHIGEIEFMAFFHRLNPFKFNPLLKDK